ncbi:MAG: FliM/FliN family flagellar motor switch protein [bacterium]
MAEDEELDLEEEASEEEPTKEAGVSEEAEAVEEEKEKEEGQRKILEYNFRKPVSDQLSPKELRDLRPRFEAFARLVERSLSASFRTGVKMTTDELTQVKYEEFIASLSAPYILVIINMAPFRADALVELEPAVTFNILERSLGGLGETKDLERKITDVEASVVAEVVEGIFDCWSETWKDAVEFKSQVLNVVQNMSEFVQTIPDYEVVVLSRTTLAIEGREEQVSGGINLCLPFRVMGLLVAKLKGKDENKHVEVRVVNPETLEKMKRRMNVVKMPVVCELGLVGLTVGEVVQLQVGDVVKLKTKATDNLLLKVSEQAKFRVTPGTVGSKLGVQIREVIEELSGDVIFKEVG